jgi:adenine phosphoribosyltransferase
LLVDDLLATGGTASAARNLIQSTGAAVVGIGFVVELTFLDGTAKLPGSDVYSLIKY